MAKLTEKVTIFQRDLEVEVEYNYSSEEEVNRYSNGDPGHPASEDLEIIGVTVEGKDYTEVFDRIDRIFDNQEGYESVYSQLEDLLDPVKTARDAAEW